MISLMKYCGWYGGINEFLQIKKEEWMNSLQLYHINQIKENASASQKNAWNDCYDVLKREFEKLDPSLKEASIIFEYELPRERGRRPDVIILSDEYVLIFEFKSKNYCQESDIDQVRAYARDLNNYHQDSHNKLVIPFLVLTKSKMLKEEINDVLVISPENLNQVCVDLLSKSHKIKTNVDSWIKSDYVPLPSLVQAARDLFENEPLPQIKRAQSYGIPKTLERLRDIAKNAQNKKEKHLALITGVPGAGKTLVGLQFVYSSHLFDSQDTSQAVFLSGNGPLINVLQHALKNKIFVQDVHGFLKTYGGDSDRVPNEHIWIYDEAQRAWDSEKVLEKRGHQRSEPLDFLYIGEKKEDWALMVGLIGEGQEIHLGEESGLAQWNEAIKSTPSDWIVSCPSHIADFFSDAVEVRKYDELNLSKTIRSHLAEEIHMWVNFLLNDQIEDSKNIAENMRKKGFDLYCTRDLQKAKDYVISRYNDSLDKRYGLIASSKAKNLPGIHNDYSWTRNFRPGPWYNDDPSSSDSCCQLREVATEFSCQGLELDFPIVCWGNDLKWGNSTWIPLKQTRSKAKDPDKLRINSYRVLLTRGRDGFAIFIPNDIEMEETYKIILNAGALPLK